MTEVKRTSVRARVYKKFELKDSALSDFGIYLVSSNDYQHLPPSIKAASSSHSAFFKVTGTNLPNVTQVEIEYYGEWKDNKKYGVQFCADSYSFIEPNTEKGIISFLSSKAFPQIGKATATNIVGEFGRDTFNIIKDAPNKLLTVPGITPRKLGLIVTAYKKNQSYSELASFLATFGLTSDQIVKINDRYGSDAVNTIRENPYIIQRIRGVGFRTCDRIGRELNVALNSYERIAGGIFETIGQALARTGDTCMRVNDFERNTLKLLNEGLKKDAVTVEMFHDVARTLARNGDIVFRKKQYVTTAEYDNAEKKTAEKLKEMLQNEPKLAPLMVRGKIEEICCKQAFTLSENQKEAVKLALTSRVSIITGGPGTGKSTILAAIIDSFRALYPNLEVVLMSPTGKAARRMSETSHEDAFTIHSKLHIFEANSEPEPLPNGLIVIDESSMVDTLLLEKVAEAISPHSFLLFIGDKDQLPSVGAGSVLNDMITSGVIPTARLTEIFRQKDGSSIIENAKKINEGNTSISFNNNDFVFVEANSEEDALEKIEVIYEKEVKTYGVDNVALLTPLRKLQAGRNLKVVADGLNVVLQNMVNPRSTQKYCSLYGTEYRVGDRVLQWKNTEMSANGDIGEILDIGETDSDIGIKIRWDNGNETIETRNSMANISLAYAISIHKSQGSQYDSVVIPMLSSQKCSLFRRNLLYTGVTRAKKKVIIVGDRKAIDSCIRTENAANRLTLFKERLQAK